MSFAFALGRQVQKGRTNEVVGDGESDQHPLQCVYAAYGFVWSGHEDGLIRYC